jgi:Ni/Co efflux regulator RcnB
MKKLLLILMLAVMCSSVARAGSYEDDSLEIQRQQAEEGGYIIRMQDAEDDHNDGIENYDSDHSLEDHDDSNSYDY